MAKVISTFAEEIVTMAMNAGPKITPMEPTALAQPKTALGAANPKMHSPAATQCISTGYFVGANLYLQIYLRSGFCTGPSPLNLFPSFFWNFF